MAMALALREEELQRFVSSIIEAIKEGELEWRKIHSRLAKIYPSPPIHRHFDFWTNNEPLVKVGFHTNTDWPDLSADEIPDPEGKSLKWVLREIIWMSAACRTAFAEQSPSIIFSQLSDNEAQFPLSESEEYQLLLLHFFLPSSLPEPFAFLERQDEALTSWITQEAIHKILVTESHEKLLSNVSQNLIATGSAFGKDLMRLLYLLHLARLEQWSIYYLEPGT